MRALSVALLLLVLVLIGCGALSSGPSREDVNNLVFKECGYYPGNLEIGKGEKGVYPVRFMNISKKTVELVLYKNPYGEWDVVYRTTNILTGRLSVCR